MAVLVGTGTARWTDGQAADTLPKGPLAVRRSAQRMRSAAASGWSPYSVATAAAQPRSPPWASRLIRIAAPICAGVARSDGCSVLANSASARPSTVMTDLPITAGRPGSRPGGPVAPVGSGAAVAANEQGPEHQRGQPVRAEHGQGQPVD